jgi:hypothetical protein
MHKIIFAAALFLAPMSAYAEDAKDTSGGCHYTYDYAKNIGEIAAKNDPTALFINYAPADAQKLIAMFNSTPPSSEIVGTHFMVLKRGELVSFLITTDSCVIHAGQVSNSQWRQFELAALGSPS